MKNSLIALALLTSSLPCLANTLDQQVQTLLDTQQYTKAVQLLTSQPSPLSTEQQLLHIKALARTPDKIEEAETLSETLLESQPNHAKLHRISASIKFMLAQQSSIFSAPGYAKEGLTLLKKARELDKSDDDTLASLISFYANAPGLVGGDEDEAVKLAKAWYARAPLDGGLMLVQALTKQGEDKQAEQLRDELRKQYPNDHRILAERAKQAAEAEQFSEAVSLIQKAIAQAPEDKYKLEYQYQLGRLSAIHKVESQAGIKALEAYTQYYARSDSSWLIWAKARLARIYLNDKQAKLAQPLLNDIDYNLDRDDDLKGELKKLKKML